AELRPPVVLEPGLERGQRHFHADLGGRAGVAVGERQISGAARGGGERQAYDPCAHRLLARRLGSEADQPGALNFLAPPRGGGLGRERLGAALHWRTRGDRRGGQLDRRWRRLLEPRLEPEARQQIGEARFVAGRELQVLEVEGQLHVAFHREEL